MLLDRRSHTFHGIQADPPQIELVVSRLGNEALEGPPTIFVPLYHLPRVSLFAARLVSLQLHGSYVPPSSERRWTYDWLD